MHLSSRQPVPNTLYEVSGYVEDKDGGVSPTATQFVTYVTTQTVLVNQGTGSISVSWDGGSAQVGANQYLAINGTASNLSVTLLTSGASYSVRTNGDLTLVQAAAGVAGVQLNVSTSSYDTMGTAPAPDSAPLTWPLAFRDVGHIGTILLPAGNATLGASTLSLSARGDLGSISGPSGSADRLWARATQLYFRNLTDSITGLDNIGMLNASGWLGDEVTDEVWANHGIGWLQAYGVKATVTGNRSYTASDQGTWVTVGDGGVPGVLDLGQVGGAVIRGDVNRFTAASLAGNFTVAVPALLNLLTFRQVKPAQAPQIVARDGVINQILAGDNVNRFVLMGGITADEIRNLFVRGSLQVGGAITARFIGRIGVDRQFQADSLTATEGPLVSLTVGGTLKVNKDIEAATYIGQIIADADITAKRIIAHNGDIKTIWAGGRDGDTPLFDKPGNLTTTIKAKGRVDFVFVNGNFTGGVLPNLIDAGSVGQVRVYGRLGGVEGMPGLNLSGVIKSTGRIDAIEVHGDIYLDSITGASIGQVEVQKYKNAKGNINASLTATGGTGIGSIDAFGSILGNIKAKRGTQAGEFGNIGKVWAGIALPDEIHADGSIGLVEVTVADKAVTTKISAQAASKELEIVIGFQAFLGSVTFAYGDAPLAPVNLRHAAQKRNEILIVRDTQTVNNQKRNVNTAWTMATTSADMKVYVKEAEFNTNRMGVFDLRGQPSFVRFNPPNDAVTDWQIEKGTPQ